MKIYMDNCCYNRPYDDQTYIRIHLETEAKLHIQDIVKRGEVDLVTSFMLEYENGKNRFSHKKQAIAGDIMESGVKSADALHVACPTWVSDEYVCLFCSAGYFQSFSKM